MKATREERQAERKAKRPAKYRNLATHKERMIERRAEQNLRQSKIDPVALDRFCRHWRAINARNGVGSSKRRRSSNSALDDESNPAVVRA